MHYCSSSHLLLNHPKSILFNFIKPLLGFIYTLVLLSLPFHAAIAGQIATIDFESGSIVAGKKLQNGFSWAVGKNTAVSSKNAKEGSHSLKFTFPGVPDGKDSFSEQRFLLGGHYPELWVKYDLYIPKNYFHRNSSGSDNNKGFFKIWGGTYKKDDREGPLLGPSFWPHSDGTSKTIIFADAYINGTKNISNHLWKEPDEGQKNHAISINDKGHWMTIVIHVKYASKSNNDGVFELWKTDWQGNTTKLHDVHKGAWYATMPNSTEPARGFDAGYLLGWANSGYNEETVFYLDNITFSTTPLSNDYVPDNTASPKPPTIISNL